MEKSQWLTPATVAQVVAGENNAHDGFVEIHVAIAMNSSGVKALRAYLKTKVRGIDTVEASGNALKVIAKARRGNKRSGAELQKLGNNCVKHIGFWEATCSPEEIVDFTASWDERIRRATASSSWVGSSGSYNESALQK